jgi:dienelactone hydrolase
VYSIEKLKISVYGARPVPNTFYRQDANADQLAVVFPGYRYRCDGPLLYHPSRMLLSSGADVLLVEYAYDALAEWRSSDSETRKRWLSADSAAAFHTASEQRPYKRIALVGKSLGTQAMGHLIASEPATRHARALWLTPILTDPELGEQLEKSANPSLLVIGSADDYYDSKPLNQLRRKVDVEILVVPEANHVLEAGDGALRSIEILKDVMEAVQRFFSK